MSLTQSVTKAIDEVIHNFIQQISTKYDLDPNEVLTVWEGGAAGAKLTKKTPVAKISVADIPADANNEELVKLKKTELQELCRQRGVKCTGTKTQLIEYILGNVTKETTPKKAKKEVSKKVTSTPIAKKLTSAVPVTAVRRNQYGNHEHPETSLIFDKKTNKVIGKQNGKNVDELTDEDIDTCNQYKFTYVLPSNLDKKTKLDDEKIDELDEDGEEEEIVESEDEEILLNEEELLDDEEDGVVEDDDEEEYE